MSDDENNTDGSGESQEVLYNCKKCPPSQMFTKPELENHRAMHMAKDAKKKSDKACADK